MRRKFLFSESRLSEVTGLSRAQLKGCRVKGEYRSGKGKGRPVELSQKAVDVVLEKYGIKEVNLDGARLGSTDGTWGSLNQKVAEALESRVTKTETAFGVVRSIPSTLFTVPDLKLVHVSQLVPNKRILRATNGTGEIYQVIVPSSEVWAISDPMRIKPSQAHKGYWQLEGKAPRWRGDRIYRHEFV